MRQSGDSAVKDISFELFGKLCSELDAMGTNSLFLTGEGEPLLHPRIFDMTAAAKEAGLHVTLVTNGTLLDGAAMHSLISSRLDALRVSLWAGSAQEYEKNYPGSDPDNFNRVVEGLRLLARLKAGRNSHIPSVILHHPINCNNFKNIDAMADLAHETGCNALSFSPLKCWWGSLAPLSLSGEEEKSLIRTLKRIRGKLDCLSLKHNIGAAIVDYNLRDDVWQKMPCYIAWLHARIKVNGTVLPCQRCSLAMGNLDEKGLRDIWNGQAFRTFRGKSITLRGLASMGEYCDCSFCGWVDENRRVHRIFKWISFLR
jgi:MoaA/NifB/PqqE/SkfB family radical SAM enzyme